MSLLIGIFRKAKAAILATFRFDSTDVTFDSTIETFDED